jgi:hypothetical protein
MFKYPFLIFVYKLHLLQANKLKINIFSLFFSSFSIEAVAVCFPNKNL